MPCEDRRGHRFALGLVRLGRYFDCLMRCLAALDALACKLELRLQELNRRCSELTSDIDVRFLRGSIQDRVQEGYIPVSVVPAARSVLYCAAAPLPNGCAALVP